ncbi:hypothetical protein [Caulobacter hibisci]|uniref:Uncharacterized protein n=1 Tax=Caulobacter hibisci TaxID=2035993 RepID=A0ABS0SRX1_9CAUL|nr:hypothetical protein [Caulobacter hibisci]MBI1682367.1 hypothetical protein [Caulobacter hibisci]
MTETEAKAQRELVREVTMSFLAVGTMLLIAYFVWAVLNIAIPARNENLAFAVLGIIGGTMVGGIFGAYFGIQLAQSRQSKSPEGVTVTAPGESSVTVDSAADPKAGQ